MSKKRNEKKVVKEFMDRARAELGGFWWKVHGSMFQLTGNPDVCGCVQGLYIAPEFKDGNNKLSPVQKTRIKQIREAGGFAGGYWSADEAIKDIKRHVKNFTLQKAEDSRKVVRKKKGARIIHGARDWEDNHRFVSSGSKTTKKK
jgi:hypothetical protein